jgi:phenylpropionate dioxygenase-like ring-hydroxylating dioxygenase large terminal subunit
MYDGLSANARINQTYFVRDLPYSFDFLVENFFCPAHIPFAHHGLQGVRDDGSPIPMEIVVNNFTTVEVGYQDRIRNRTRQ